MTEHEEQQLPTPNQGVHIHDLVSEDHQGRKAIGIERYGTPLGADNGRDALRDAYEESLDLSVYLRQAIEERNLALETLRERLENAVPDTVTSDGRKGVLDEMIELITPFVATPGRAPVVRWHDSTGETWPVTPGKIMHFPGGLGSFSLSFGEEKAEPAPTPSPFASAADAAYEAVEVMLADEDSHVDITKVHEALSGVDEVNLDRVITAVDVLCRAVVERKSEAVRARLREMPRARVVTELGVTGR